MQRLLAIDALNLVRRVYEANPERDGLEKAETAVHNATLSFRRLLDQHHPTHALAAFDAGGPTWRNDIHPPYRSARRPMPEPLKISLPDLQARLEGLGLHALCLEGVEADDVIATAVLRWLDEQRGEAIVVSTDKDLHQLVAQGARVWDYFKGEWHDRAWVQAKYGVAPEQLADLLALVGDSADGIPGIEKIGQKTAAKLLESYGDLDGIFAGAGILLTPQGQKLRAGRDAAYLSRRLVQLKTDVRLGVTWRTLQRPA